MLVRKIIFYILFHLAALSGLAQQKDADSIKQLNEVVVIGNRLTNFSSGIKTQQIDSATLSLSQHENLSDILQKNTQGFIKTYGLGSLATSSFRGGGASQTSVLWNGFNLQSPMNGQLDLALVPVLFIDDLKLQFGGCGSLWGSGSIGATIHLNNKEQYNQGLRIRLTNSYGSYSNVEQGLNITVSKKRFISSAKIFWHDAQNNFTYINTQEFGNPETKQSNAHLNQYGFLFDNYFKISKRQQINLRIWHQYNDRQIPPLMTQPSNVSYQIDKFLRISSEWKRIGDKTDWYVRAAYFNEWLRYVDQPTNLDEVSNSICQISEIENKTNIGKNHSINIGINNTNSTANTDSYINKPYQNRTALFGSYKFYTTNQKFNTVLSLRKEVIYSSRNSGFSNVPIIPSLGAEWKFAKKFTLKGNVTRNYRIPTFNDLYWVPGGNPNLKPEQGWSEELGTYFDWFNGKCSDTACVLKPVYFSDVHFNITGYNRIIQDWIIWLPQGNLWTPDNLMKVWSRGLEVSAFAGVQVRKVKLSFSGKYDYTLSTNQEVPADRQNELNKQLIYVPLHKLLFEFKINYKTWKLGYDINYTSWIFATADNDYSNLVDGYILQNLVLSKQTKIGNHAIDVFFKVNNLTGENYQVLAYRAMPGRNYQVGLAWEFNKRNKN